MKRVQNKQHEVGPPINDLYYDYEIPKFPEIHKDDVCRYYTSHNGITYVLTYLRHKPTRWKSMISTDLGYPPYRHWNHLQPTRLIVHKVQYGSFSCIADYMNVTDGFVQRYLKEGLANLFMEELL